MKTIKFNLNLNSTLVVLMMAGVLTACGGGGGAETPSSVDETAQSNAGSTEAPSPTPAPAPAPAPAPNPAGITGKALWASHCASCHGGDYGKGVNAGETMSAIASNKGGMGILNGVINLDKASQIAVFTSSPGSY